LENLTQGTALLLNMALPPFFALAAMFLLSLVVA